MSVIGWLRRISKARRRLVFASAATLAAVAGALVVILYFSDMLTDGLYARFERRFVNLPIPRFTRLRLDRIFRLIFPLAGLGVAGLLVALRGSGLFRDLARWWHGVPVSHRLLSVGLLCAMIVGHARAESRDNFPLVRWGMYVGAFEPKTIVEYRAYGVTPEGREVLINMARTMPPIHRGAPRMFTELAAAALGDSAAPDNLRLLDDMATAMVRLAADLQGERFQAARVKQEVVLRPGGGGYSIRPAVVVREILIAAP